MSKWKLGEKEVYDYYSSQRHSYIYRFTDTHDVNSQLKGFNQRMGINQPNGMVYVPANPSDFLVIYKNRTFFLEVKTTENIKGVTYSLFKQQEGFRDRIIRCGGEYWYHIYSIVNKQWYMVPGELIAEKPTCKWEELNHYKIDYLKVL